MCLNAQLLSLVDEVRRQEVCYWGWIRKRRHSLGQKGEPEGGTESQGIEGRAAGGPKTQLCLVLNPP